MTPKRVAGPDRGGPEGLGKDPGDAARGFRV